MQRKTLHKEKNHILFSMWGVGFYKLSGRITWIVWGTRPRKAWLVLQHSWRSKVLSMWELLCKSIVVQKLQNSLNSRFNLLIPCSNPGDFSWHFAEPNIEPLQDLSIIIQIEVNINVNYKYILEINIYIHITKNQ